MLVPEIALTPQLERRVAQRFAAANVVSLHTGLADGARSRGFVQALSGHADIVLGTRLAVFAPLPRLGLILVDEEHDASYKQQEGARYSACDLAV
jgi:primosomal protein N' (replication factor Y)